MVIAAVLTIEQFGPAGLKQEQIVRIVLDVLNGRRSVQQSILLLFLIQPTRTARALNRVDRTPDLG